MNPAKALCIASLLLVTTQLHAAVVTQTSTDVQILQAWRGDSYEISATACTGDDPAVGQTVAKDCSVQGDKLARAAWADRSSPALNNWLLPVHNAHGYIYSPNSAGHLVEIRALVKRRVLTAPTFTGIGFYFTNLLSDGIRVIPKSALHIVSDTDVTLAATGEKAAVLRFVLVMPGEAGDSGTGWSMDSVSFKPFAQFDADGTTFQNWEPLSTDYRIYRETNGGGRPQSTSFDRQGELLAP